MDPASKSRTDGREPDAGTTPAPDMQPEDAGTAASGNDDSATEDAMKQKHNSEAQRDSKR